MSIFFVYMQKTAYEVRISDWSSDVCSSDLVGRVLDEVQVVDERLGDLAGHGGAVEDLVAQPGSEADRRADHALLGEIGRATSRERVCQSVSISVVAVKLKK